MDLDDLETRVMELTSQRRTLEARRKHVVAISRRGTNAERELQRMDPGNPTPQDKRRLAKLQKVLRRDLRTLHKDDPTLPIPEDLLRYGRLRRKLVVVVVVVVVVVAAVCCEIWGLPHVRLSSGRYWSITGTRHVAYGELGETMPTVAMLPLEKYTWTYAGNALAWGGYGRIGMEPDPK